MNEDDCSLAAEEEEMNVYFTGYLVEPGEPATPIRESETFPPVVKKAGTWLNQYKHRLTVKVAAAVRAAGRRGDGPLVPRGPGGGGRGAALSL